MNDNHNTYFYDPFYLRNAPREGKRNCTIPDIVDFPNIMRKKGVFNTIICILMSAYLFIFLAILCDKYLVPAMERLCYSLHLSYDVAGATFLAAATSAPELFVAVVGTFVTEGDIGIGTIVGSSVFNLLGIAAVCGIFTGIASQLDWWPLSRDIFWYLVSIILLFVVLYDAKVLMFEAIGLLSGYVVYVVALSYDRKIQKVFRNVDDDKDMVNEDPLNREGDERLNSFKENLCTRPEENANIIWKIWWAIEYPATIVLALTTPSPRSPYFLTLLVSIIWIGVISYLLTWFLTVVGYNLGIPDAIMGLTVLAVGTSIPEVVSSYIVCRKGMASMAMCNAIGANTFDIFICLGLPWTLKLIFETTESERLIHINSNALGITVGMLIVASIVLYSCLLVTKFIMGQLVGWLSLIMYTLFLIVACTIEMKYVRKMCDIESPEYENLHK